MSSTSLTTREDLWKALRGKWHLHLCPRCRQVYDDTCVTPETNMLCRFCKGSVRPVWLEHRKAQECCEHAELITSLSTRVSYKLAGEQAWGLCPHCKRVSSWD